MSEIGELLHPAGTIILCENGHRVARVVRDLHRGDSPYADAIGEFEPNQTIPMRGDHLPLRCHCGAIWFTRHRSFLKTTR